jgi:hypothetical protein
MSRNRFSRLAGLALAHLAFTSLGSAAAPPAASWGAPC